MEFYIGSIRLGKDDNTFLDKSHLNIDNALLSGSNYSNTNGVAKIEDLKEATSDSNGVSEITTNTEKESDFYGDDTYEWLFDDDDQETPPKGNASSDYDQDSLFTIENLAVAESSSEKSRTNSSHEHSSSTLDLADSYDSRSSWYSAPSYNVPNYPNVGLDFGDGYGTLSTSIYKLERQNELCKAALMAQARENSNYMAQVIKLFEVSNYNERTSLLSALQGSVLWIMVDEQLHPLFLKVVHLCNEDQLTPIVEEILSREDLFIDAAFCKIGSNAIVKLVKKLKNTDYAFAITSILASRFYELTTHPTARIVIQHCLYHLGNRANEVLYEQAILLFKDLAVNAVGCRFLNEHIIDTIAGEQKSRLLLDIARAADFLSHDPFGNFVVQHVLELKREEINDEIFSRLEGQFVLLAHKKGGSHVVEKCIESSSRGTFAVVKDILKHKGAAILLARDIFGNYVIQKALKMTKIYGFTSLNRSLVEALEHFHKELKRSAGGKQVISLIEDDIHYRRQSKFSGTKGDGC